jgi:hypothetical protein
MHAVTPRLANQTTISFKNEVSAVVVVAQIIFCSKLYKENKRPLLLIIHLRKLSRSQWSGICLAYVLNSSRTFAGN